jgi:O-antigen/teichoic acid export membrane protein
MQEIKKKVYSGFSYLILTRLLSYGFSVIKFLILARYIEPYHFGLIGSVWLFFTVTDIVISPSLNLYLVQKNDNKIDDYFDTVFWVGFFRGLFLFLIIRFFSGHISSFFNDKNVFYAINYLSFIFLINSFSNPRAVYMTKDLEFEKKLYSSFIISLTDFIFSVYMLKFFKDFKLFIYSSLFTTFIGNFIWYYYYPYLPKFKFSFEKFKEMISFSKWVNISNILGYLLQNFDDWMVAKFLGPGKLAIYQLAYRVSNQPVNNLAGVINEIFFPVYSKIKEDKNEVYNLYLKIITLFGCFGFFWVLILFSYSDYIIDLFFNNNWKETSLIIKFLSFYIIFKIYAWANGIIFISQGKPSINTALMFIETVFMIPFVIYLTKKFGLYGTCIAVTFPIILVSLIGYFKIKNFFQIEEDKIFMRVSFLIFLNFIFYILNFFILKLFVWYVSIFVIVNFYMLTLYFIDKSLKTGLIYNFKDFLFAIIGRYEKI